MQQRGVERYLVDTVEDAPCRAWHTLADGRIDLDDQNIRARRSAQDWHERRIAHIAAVPVMLTFDFDRLKQEWQAGGRHDDVRRDLVALKNPATPCLHIGCRDEQFQILAPAHFVEIDQVGNHRAEGIDVERIEIIGRGDALQHVEPEIGGRPVETPKTERGVDRVGTQRAQLPHIAYRLPESGESCARFGRPPIVHSLRCHNRIDSAGAGAAYAFDPEPIILENPVENAPGERAMRPAALKREVDRLDVMRFSFAFQGYKPANKSD